MMNKNKFVSVLLAVTLASTALMGCQAQKEASEDINMVLSSSPNTADPQKTADVASALLTNMFTAGLYEYDENRELVPCLAESHDVSEDGCTYTFHLKKDLKWSDGRDLTADDFVYGFERLVDPEVGSGSVYMITDCCTVKNAKDISAGKMSVSELGVLAPDKDTFVVELETPCPYFCALTAAPCLAPCNINYFHSVGPDYANSEKPQIYCGAYMMDKYEPLAAQIHLTKNPYYAEADKITVSGINLQVVGDSQQGMMCFESGSMDIVPISGELAELSKDSDELHVFPSATLYYFEINQRTCTPLMNKNIRMALSKSINREDIATKIMKSGYLSSTRLIPPNFYKEQDGSDFSKDLNAYDKYAAYDPDEAAKLWKQGLEELGVSTVSIGMSFNADTKNLIEAMSAQMKEALPGLEIEFKGMTGKDLFASKEKGEYDILFIGWVADYADPTGFLEEFLSNETKVGYDNPEYDNAYSQAMSPEMANKPAERDKLLHKAEDMIMEDAGIIPVFTKGENYMIRSSVKGFSMAPAGGYATVTGLKVEGRGSK